MNRELPTAVIATFREESRDVVQRRLLPFGLRAWRQAMHWLDTSGLALYFLHRLTSLDLEDCIPPEVLGQLQQRQGHNCLRTQDLFGEFVLINQAFQEAGLRYINLKGFSLVPEYCQDLSHRYQLDLDFLMSRADNTRCCTLLKSLGYEAIQLDDDVLEFRTGMEHVPSIHDLYKPKSRRSVEVHFAISLQEKVSTLLQRSRMRSADGLTFPVLSETDMFLAQTLHLFKHVKGEWTRLSWLLEFRAFVAARRGDSSLWKEVRALSANVPQGTLGVGVVTWLCTELLGEFAPSELTGWSVAELPAPVRLWLERYGRTALLSQFPGTKLYLLLRGELLSDRSGRSEVTRGKLFPLHRAPKVAYVTRGSIGSRLRAFADQFRFVLFRLRFHIAESSRYLIEVQRWNRIVNGSAG